MHYEILLHETRSNFRLNLNWLEFNIVVILENIWTYIKQARIWSLIEIILQMLFRQQHTDNVVNRVYLTLLTCVWCCDHIPGLCGEHCVWIWQNWLSHQ